jgi:hypothetical protein
MLNEASVEIDSPPLVDYGDYNHDLEERLEGDEFGEEEDIDERRAHAEENWAMDELITAENAPVMMNPTKMDEARIEWWNLTKTEILARMREAARAAIAAMNARGDDATASRGGHVDAPATNGDA